MIKVAMRSRVGREPARGEGTALLVCSAQPWAALDLLATPLAWRPGQRHPSIHVGEQVVLLVRRVGKRRSESGGFSRRWRRWGSLDPSPHSALSHSPWPPADFSGAVKCCLKCVLSLIQKRPLEKPSSGNTGGRSFSWTSIHCKARVRRAILNVDGSAGPPSSS